MKKIVLLILFCFSGLLAVGEEISEKEMKKLQRDVKISSVSDRKMKNQDGEEVFLLKFDTNQDEDNDEGFSYRFRVTVELTDKAKNSYFAQIQGARRDVNEDYIGEDSWEFQIPLGKLERPKLTAYAIQYGILNDGKLIPLAEDFDDVDTLEELTERSPNRLDGNIKLTQHIYLYDDDGTEEEKVKKF